MSGRSISGLAGITLCLTLGCGGGARDFIGTWNYTGGSANYTCPDGSTTETLEGNVSFSEGTESDLALLSDECNLKFSVDGSSATVEPGQSCSQSGSYQGYAYTETLTPTVWTFTLSEDGNSLTEAASVTYALDFEGEDAYVCTIQVTGTLTKVGE